MDSPKDIGMRTTPTLRESPAADDAWSEQRTEAIRAVARDAVATGDVPGVVSLVCHRGNIVHAEAEGLRDIDNQLAMERSTIFGIASMSKPITSVLALTLIQEGRIRLEDPIAKWLPEFSAMRVLRRPDAPLDDTYPSPRAITIEDLMTHRSGQMESRLLKPATVDLMTSNRLTAAQREFPLMGNPFFKAKGFGLGVSVVTDPEHLARAAGRGSFGWPGGFGGWWQADPENELVLLWFQQCVPSSPIATANAGSAPRMPGARAVIEFQNKAYSALAC